MAEIDARLEDAREKILNSKYEIRNEEEERKALNPKHEIACGHAIQGYA